MNADMMIPQGNQTVTVELTVKEALALSGSRFNWNSKLLARARRKLKEELDRKLLAPVDAIRYESLEA